MELKDFIRESLTQIVDGALAAHEQMKKKGAAVNPMQTGQAAIIAGSIRRIENVEFDVALTDAEKQSSEGGIGVFLGSFGIGAKAQKGTEASSLARIRFKIPIGLPEGQR